MKIVSVNGSHGRYPIGHTQKLIEFFIASLREVAGDEPIEYEAIKLVNCNVTECDGCCRCFRRMDCPVEDDHKAIFEKMSQADVIILGSPTYVGNISARMKTFLERSSFAMHRRLLTGKYGVVFSAMASPDSQGKVVNYLSNILRCMGVAVTSEIEYAGFFIPDSPSPEKKEELIDKAAKLFKAVKNREDLFVEPEFGCKFETESKKYPELFQKFFAKDMSYINKGKQ